MKLIDTKNSIQYKICIIALMCNSCTNISPLQPDKDASVVDSGLMNTDSGFDAGESVDSGPNNSNLDSGSDSGFFDASVDSGVDAGILVRDAGPTVDAGMCILNSPEFACGTRPCCQQRDQCLPSGMSCTAGDIAMRCRFGRDCGPGLQCFLSGSRAECSLNKPDGGQKLCDPTPPDAGPSECVSPQKCERENGNLFSCQ